jgi:hypothetical protein
MSGRTNTGDEVSYFFSPTVNIALEHLPFLRGHIGCQ